MTAARKPFHQQREKILLGKKVVSNPEISKDCEVPLGKTQLSHPGSQNQASREMPECFETVPDFGKRSRRMWKLETRNCLPKPLVWRASY
jgi:hypothetical protein